jgi:glycosyltransferase involved in cell wall biosynthesis
LKSKKLRVLIIATTNFELDGITNVILNYYRAMDKSDMQIDIVTPNDIRDDLRIEIESFGSKIYKINGRTKNPISYIKKLSTLICENNYLIVHAHGNSCTLALEMLAAKFGGAKVRIPHSHNTKTKYSFVNKMLRKIFDLTYTHAFACGQKAGEWLFNKEPFVIINNGISIENYKFNLEVRQKYREKYNLNGKKVIGHVGHFNHQKNHDFLIDVFAEIFKIDNSYRLLLIGDGKLRPDIENKVNELGLTEEVIFTGKSLDVPQLMQAIDMVVMPSRYEGLPLTLVEAQAACLNCFVSDTVSNEVAITELINFLSLEITPKEWADRIYSCNRINRDEKKETVLNQIIMAGYSIKNNAENLKKLYSKYYYD